MLRNDITKAVTYQQQYFGYLDGASIGLGVITVSFSFSSKVNFQVFCKHHIRLSKIGVFVFDF